MGLINYLMLHNYCTIFLAYILGLWDVHLHRAIESAEVCFQNWLKTQNRGTFGQKVPLFVYKLIIKHLCGQLLPHLDTNGHILVTNWSSNRQVLKKCSDRWFNLFRAKYLSMSSWIKKSALMHDRRISRYVYLRAEQESMAGCSHSRRSWVNWFSQGIRCWLVGGWLAFIFSTLCGQW